MGDRRLFRHSRPRPSEGAVAVATPATPVTPLSPVAPHVPPGSPQAVDQSCVRSLITVKGTITDVSLGSRGDAPALEVGVDAVDAETGRTEHVVLVWLGRAEIAGIHPGREIVATARFCAESGAHVMYNPRYDLR